jgi:signal transduction histidine kinase
VAEVNVLGADGVRCVIVDDNDRFVHGFSHLLARLGFRVIGVAFSSAEALRLVADVRPDVAFIDLHLGDGESGVDLIADFTRMGLTGRMYTILVSASARDELDEACAISEADAYLSKNDLCAEVMRDIAQTVTATADTPSTDDTAPLPGPSPCRTAEREALRAVATLVMGGASPSEVFWIVCRALGSLLNADYASIGRFEPDRTVCHLAVWHDPRVPAVGAPFGGRWPMGDDTATAEVYRTGQPVRRSSVSIFSEVGEWLRSRGVGQVAVCPVIVDGRTWGMAALLFLDSRPVLDGIETRMLEFVELLGCTIAQAEYRAELMTSRARLITASDATRRRIERDLHDGAQQRLVALGLALREAEENVPRDNDAVRRPLSNATECLSEALVQLREISHGLHPAILTQKGLVAAIRALAHHCPVPTELRTGIDRQLPEQIQVTLYYVVSEALTNVLKHANASIVHIDLSMNEDAIHLSIRDDGVGGANLRGGSGLSGLKDRVETVEGTIEVSSPIGGGTSLLINIPAHADKDIRTDRTDRG